ncbi:CGNR zinc finger domain-containing protein [Nocardioides aestuarii]|uniref:CGNR zinc finger domain-containing protein n=1 Tax=Nocardioides aestuarii TaxID=252231 RepID=A0ABW4TTS8_9ACTN
MVFAYDSEMSLQSAVELVNSAEEPDTLDAVADLDDFWSRWRYTGRHDRTRAELSEVRDLRPRLRALLLAPRDEAVELVNAALSEVSFRPALVRHEEFDWHLHAVDHDAPLAERILVETAMAMVDVIRADEHSRIGVCADDGCGGVVLDLSRNRSRRYCSTTCANRNAVAAYRARRS